VITVQKKKRDYSVGWRPPGLDERRSEAHLHSHRKTIGPVFAREWPMGEKG
jgi:hypothetical protein